MDASRNLPRCPLINTARLRPLSQRLNALTITITSKGEVTLQFRGYHRTSQADVTSEADSRLEELRISPDGRQIHSCNRLGRSPPREGGERRDPPGRIYSYPNLPEKLWKRYHYAYKFVEVIRSRTAKVVLFTGEAKCKLMENSPVADFQILFYNGMALLFSKAQVTVSDQEGRQLTLDMDGASLCLHPNIYSLVEYGQECWKRCLQIEESVSCHQSDIPGQTLFPLTIRSAQKCLTVNQLTPEATCHLSDPTSTLQRSLALQVTTPADLDDTHPPHPYVHPEIKTSCLSPCSDNQILINDLQCLSPFHVDIPQSLTDHKDSDPLSRSSFISTCSEYSSSGKDSLTYEPVINTHPQTINTSQSESLALSDQDKFAAYHSSSHAYKQCRPIGSESPIFHSLPQMYQSKMYGSSNMIHTTTKSTTFANKTKSSAVSTPLNSFSTPPQSVAREYCPHFYSDDVVRCKKPQSAETQLSRGNIENVRKKLFSQEDPLNNNLMSTKKSEATLKEIEFANFLNEGTRFLLDKAPHEDTSSVENISKFDSFNGRTSEHAYRGSGNGIHACVSFPSTPELKYKHDNKTNNQTYPLEDKKIPTTSLSDDHEHIPENELYSEQSITTQSLLDGAFCMTHSPSRNDSYHMSKRVSYNSSEVDQDVDNLPDVIAATTPTALKQVQESPVKCLPIRTIANLSLPENSNDSKTLESALACSANVNCNTDFCAGVENASFSCHKGGSSEDSVCSLLPVSTDPISSTCRFLESPNKLYHVKPRNLPVRSPSYQPLKKDGPTPSTSFNWGGLDFHHGRQGRSSLDVSSDGRSSSPSSTSDVLCQVFVPYSGWASFYASGTVWILYNDGTQLGVLSTETTVIFVDQDGSRTRYTNTDVVPAIVKMKLEKVPRIIDLLLNSSATLLG